VPLIHLPLLRLRQWALGPSLASPVPLLHLLLLRLRQSAKGPQRGHLQLPPQ